MKKYLVLSLFVSVFAVNQCFAINMNGIAPVNPLDANPSTYQEQVNLPSFELKKGSLTRNAIKNQYTIYPPHLLKILTYKCIFVKYFVSNMI